MMTRGRIRCYGKDCNITNCGFRRTHDAWAYAGSFELRSYFNVPVVLSSELPACHEKITLEPPYNAPKKKF